MAEDNPGGWEFCSDGGDNSYRLSGEVQDVQTGKFVQVASPGPRCRTCGSEIVETVNGSNFNNGECGPCEYDRYRSQPALLEASSLAYSVLCDLSYHWCFRGKPRRFRDANEATSALATALNDYGKAS